MRNSITIEKAFYLDENSINIDILVGRLLDIFDIPKDIDQIEIEVEYYNKGSIEIRHFSSSVNNGFAIVRTYNGYQYNLDKDLVVYIGKNTIAIDLKPNDLKFIFYHKLNSIKVRYSKSNSIL